MRCEVCGKKSPVLSPTFDNFVLDLLLLCSSCSDLYQDEHFEDLFRSPVDWTLFAGARIAA